MLPELILFAGVMLLLVLGFFKSVNTGVFKAMSLVILAACLLAVLAAWPLQPRLLFGGMVRLDDFSSYFKILFCAGAALATVMTRPAGLPAFRSEYFILIISVVLGAHLLVMSMNFILVVISLELVSIGSYVLAGFGFTKKTSEGSLKYFLFGSASTAVMIYGISMLYGLSGTLDFAGREFVDGLIGSSSPLVLVSAMLVLSGFLFKVAAVPFHLWAPDVYESAPTPVVAFLSTVPKLAGFGALAKFTIAINLFGQSVADWQLILAALALLSLLVGNFSALWQQDARRMMAYSSVAQTGFLLIGLATFTLEGMHFMLFYATSFLVSNFLVFIGLQHFERTPEPLVIRGLSGAGKSAVFSALAISVGLISLTGLPPTAGFTAKLLVFSSLWESYAGSGKTILLILFAFGLINTVVSLFFYLKIPYFLFIREPIGPVTQLKSRTIENLLGAILVVLVLLLFFQPDLLMGWINRVNFVL